jgi:transposase
MVDIDKLLEEAEHGEVGNYVERKITDEAMPFWKAIVERVQNGNDVKPYRIVKILEREFGIKISDSALRRYLRGIPNGE